MNQRALCIGINDSRLVGGDPVPEPKRRRLMYA